MIWDAFLLNDELNMLELRLRTLAQYPVMHVISESPVTFQGDSKPLYFAENLIRFRPWMDRIIYLTVDPGELPSGKDPLCLSPRPLPGLYPKAWKREEIQRNRLIDGMHDLSPDDVVLFGDVDEIPRIGSLNDQVTEPVVLNQQNHIFAVDWVHRNLWHGTIAFPWRHMGDSFQAMRDSRDRLPEIPDGGWHFSWLGGPEEIRRKAAAFSHGELLWKITENARKCCEQGWCPWDDSQLIKVPVKDMPEWIQSRKCPSSWFSSTAKLTVRNPYASA